MLKVKYIFYLLILYARKIRHMITSLLLLKVIIMIFFQKIQKYSDLTFVE